jgi:hypothetical protein
LARSEDVPPDKSGLLHDILRKYTVVVNQFFVVRTEAWFKLLLQEGIGITDFWLRYEFAKSRGAIHFHALLFAASVSRDLHKLLDRCVVVPDMNSLAGVEKEVAKEIAAYIRRSFVDIHAIHPAGQEMAPGDSCDTIWYTLRTRVARGEEENSRVVAHVRKGDEDVAPHLVGNAAKWPPHEGSGDAPNRRCLRVKVMDLKTSEERDQNKLDFVNLTSLHKCSGYCLTKRVDRGPQSEDVIDDVQWACRFGYGVENKAVAARTDGMPVHQAPLIDFRNGLPFLDPSRNHPRLVAGPQDLTWAYRANADLQLVIAASGLVPDLNGQCVLDWAEQYTTEFDGLPEEERNNLREVYQKRSYMNRSDHMRALTNYVAGYMCKGEKGPIDSVNMLRNIVESETPDSTSFASIAQRHLRKLICSRVINSAEADFLLSGLPSYESTFSTFQRASLNVGVRNVAPAEELAAESNDGSTALKKNMWDKFMDAQNKQDSAPQLSCFYDFVIQQGYGNNVIPVFTHAYLNPTWPLEEDFCRTMLFLYKTGIQKVQDVKGEYNSHVDAFQAYLRSPNPIIPEGVIKGIQRAVIHNLKNKQVANHRRRQERNGQERDGEQRYERQMDVDYELTGDGAADYDEEGQQNPQLYSQNNDQDGDDNSQNADFREAPVGYIDGSVERGHWPPFQECASWLQRIVTERENTELKKFQLPHYYDGQQEANMFYDPLRAMNNEGQRTLLCYFIKFWKDYLQLNDKSHCEPVRAIVAGAAGTGKTYVMKVMSTILSLIFRETDATLILAPTGVAAAACGGAVPDKVLGFKRTDKVFKELQRDALANKQALLERTKLLLLDEMSMVGDNMQGLIAGRCQELFNNGERTDDNMGGIPMSMLLGDHCQLPPVLERACFLGAPSAVGRNMVAALGRLNYQAHRNTPFFLDKNVRQQGDNGLKERLGRLRTGECIDNPEKLQEDADFWATRRLQFLPEAERQRFSLTDDKTVEATCFNKTRDSINQEYAQQFTDIRAVRSDNTGRHATSKGLPKEGMLKNVPLCGHYAPGMMIKLTSNLCVDLGLTNNARGILRDVVYLDRASGLYGGYRPDASLDEILLMVEIPNYSGPPLNNLMEDHDQKSWIPIAAVTLTCDANCHCKRTMFPVVPGKADSVYCLQGLTAGDTKSIQRVLLHWTSEAEARWPNILYVGASRAEEVCNVAIKNDISKIELKKVGSYSAVVEQRKEMDDLKEKAIEFRKTIDATQETFASHIQWIIEYVRQNETNFENNDDSKHIILSCMTQWEQSMEEWRQSR